MSMSHADLRAFIGANLPLAPVPAVPEIVLHTVHPASGLRTLDGDDPDAPPPYWAYQWAGGTVLARYILDHPEVVRGNRVVDLGAGSGIVAIAAMRAGAGAAMASDLDPNALAAIALNAEANGVTVTVSGDDLLDGPPPLDTDLIAVSDLLYEEALIGRALPFLDRCRAAGIAILIGDPFRKTLPLARVELIAESMVPDFGAKAPVRSGVFSLRPPS
jgi:predicted nicotinamide N-methyase